MENQQSNENLTRHDLRELRRKHAKEEREKHQSEHKTSKGKFKYFGILVLLAIVVGVGYSMYSSPTGQVVSSNQPALDYALSWYNSNNGLHWHPTLTIKINGQIQVIPENIGITPTRHYPVHTHDATGTLHWEIFAPEKPTEQNMKLEYFFQIWGKTFNSQCIFEYCSDGAKKVRMTVNGVENTEFGDYFVKDGDQIVIEYGG